MYTSRCVGGVRPRPQGCNQGPKVPRCCSVQLSEAPQAEVVLGLLTERLADAGCNPHVRRNGLSARGAAHDQVQINIDPGNKFDFDAEVDGLRAHVGRIKQVSQHDTTRQKVVGAGGRSYAASPTPDPQLLSLNLAPPLCAPTDVLQLSMAIEDERKQQGEIINGLVGAATAA